MLFAQQSFDPWKQKKNKNNNNKNFLTPKGPRITNL